MVMIFIRPKNMNEAIPATIGAIIVMLSGSVSLTDLLDISSKVTGAAVTIIATIVMAIVLSAVAALAWVFLRIARTRMWGVLSMPTEIGGRAGERRRIAAPPFP